MMVSSRSTVLGMVIAKPDNPSIVAGVGRVATKQLGKQCWTRVVVALVGGSACGANRSRLFLRFYLF